MFRRDMWRRSTAAAALLAGVLAAQIVVEPERVWGPSAPDFIRYRDFVMKLDRFDRRLGGCPDESGLDLSACDPARGYFDARLWLELRRDAQRVFRWKDGDK